MLLNVASTSMVMSISNTLPAIYRHIPSTSSKCFRKNTFTLTQLRYSYSHIYSFVGILAKIKARQPRNFGSNAGREKNFFSTPNVSRQLCRLYSYPFNRYQWRCLRELMRPDCEARYISPFVSRLRINGAIMPSWCGQRQFEYTPLS